MLPIPESIQRFISDNKVCTICFVDTEQKPYCINCFYLFDAKKQLLIFKSSKGTYHQSLTASGFVSGTILPEKLDLIKLKGIQFKGKVITATELQENNCTINYHTNYPMSLAVPGYVWAVKLDFLKFTDNTLGFGNKTTWTDK